MKPVKFRALVAAGLTAVALASSANAVNLVSNGSFETVSTPFGGDGGQDLATGSTAITSWTVVTNRVAPLTTPNAYTIVAQDGNVSLDLQSYNDGSPYGGVSQDISTVPGLQYALSFWIGVQNDDGGGIAHGPASVNAAAGATNQTFTNTNNGAGQQWQNFVLDFTASSATTTITLTGISTTGGSYIGLDNVDVEQVASTPEPASLSIALIGATALLLRRRRP